MLGRFRPDRTGPKEEREVLAWKAQSRGDLSCRSLSLWKYLFDSESRQRADINSLRAAAGVAAGTASSTSGKVDALRQRIERQELLLETMYRALIGRNIVTEEEFKDRVAQVDLEDGVEDGKIGADRVARAPKCSNCEKPASRKRTHCVYCNAELPADLRKKSRRGSAYRR